MARFSRLVVPGIPLHLVHRGHNRAACFTAPDDRRRYLDLLAEWAERAQCSVHAYVLMTNHVHLLVTPAETSSPAKLMKAVAQRHAQFMNWKLGRTGALWGGRFHSSVVQSDRYLLACYRYVELNPVRAGLVAHPRDYPWSSYRSNAEGERSQMLRCHSGYLELGPDDHARQEGYRSLFSTELSNEFLEAIRSASKGGFAIGTPEFLTHLQNTTGARAHPRPKGGNKRPAKAARLLQATNRVCPHW